MSNDEIKEAIRSRKTFDYDDGCIRIMAFAENHFMVRQLVDRPFALHAQDFENATGIKLAYR